MKQVIIIVLVLLASARVSAQSISSLSHSFSVDTPSIAELNAYEQRGVEKLKDFYDYATIISTKTYDTAMRNNAARQALSLFYSERCQIRLGAKKETVKAAIAGLKHDPGVPVEPATGITIKNHFQVQNDGSYKGLVGFTTNCNGKKCDKTISIMLKKVEKQFGSNRRAVWTVFLGDMS